LSFWLQCGLKEFISQYVLDKKGTETRQYCFILGAGASKQSGIPTGAELAKQWLKEIEQKYDTDHFNTWKKGIKLQEGNEDEKYAEIYGKRFELNPQEGYLYLESIMEKVEPSFGYSVLSQILEKTQDKIVITTNFDCLIEDAMFIYSKKRPLIIGHESLAGYVKLHTKRPTIAKIHRDIFLSPKNRNSELKDLEEGWKNNLSGILKYYTPIVIGYGGNDGSLMNFLTDNKDPKTMMFWFYWEGENTPESYLPNEKIQKLVTDYNGFIIPIKGFDEMMLQINDALGYKWLDKELIKIAEERAKAYINKITTLNEKASLEIKEVIQNISEKQARDWWTIQLEIDNEPDIDKKDKMFLNGITETNNSPELISNYAIFLKNIKKDYDKAEKHYKKALELDPTLAITIGNYAIFLENIKKDYDETEKHYKKALELDPTLANITSGYAIFLHNIKKDYDEAEKYYKKAIELDPNDVDYQGNYAIFLHNIKKDYDEAEKYYKKAIELDPNNANNVGNYALFLHNIKKDYDEAEKYYKKAIELDPNHANNKKNYAFFLKERKK
jgi:tetratricopeptide (TPR) repeat protein